MWMLILSFQEDELEMVVSIQGYIQEEVHQHFPIVDIFSTYSNEYNL
jgi:hypothetical protein